MSSARARSHSRRAASSTMRWDLASGCAGKIHHRQHPRPIGSSWSHAASSSASAWARSGIAASSTRCHLLGVPPLPQQCARSIAHGGRRTGHEDEISTAIGEGKRHRRWRFGIRRRDCGSCRAGGKGNRDVSKQGGVIMAKPGNGLG
jgi:hypothetical protein